jgi:hypothetical protein
MKKTVASLAILASASSAFALIGPGDGNPRPQPKNVCLSLYQGERGESYLGDCDNSELNRQRRAPLQANGCAAGQASLRSFSVRVKSCTGFAQL